MTWRRGYGIIGGHVRGLICSAVGMRSQMLVSVVTDIHSWQWRQGPTSDRLSDLQKPIQLHVWTMTPIHPDDINTPWYYSKYCPGDAQTLFFFDSNCYEPSVHRHLCLSITWVSHVAQRHTLSSTLGMASGIVHLVVVVHIRLNYDGRSQSPFQWKVAVSRLLVHAGQPQKQKKKVRPCCKKCDSAETAFVKQSINRCAA